MTPYYSEDGITIYHGDCREMLPLLDKADLALTDPPYGIDFGNAGGFSVSCGWGPWKHNAEWDASRPEKSTFDLVLASTKHQIIWGGNYFADMLPPSMGWLAWDKGQRNFSLADFEMAWTSYWGAARCFEYARGKAVRDGKQHPTQKPLELMVWCINHADKRSKSPVALILDPFCGSGTTLRAAKDLGRKAIGIEINERYCEIAARRLSQGVLSFE